MEKDKSSIHPIPQHGVTYILQSMEDLSDQIVDYNLHALHTSVVGICVWLVCVGASKDLCNTQQQRAEPGEKGMLLLLTCILYG